jgi:hypothetical protein
MYALNISIKYSPRYRRLHEGSVFGSEKWSINLHYGNKMAIFRIQKCYLEFKRLYLG